MLLFNIRKRSSCSQLVEHRSYEPRSWVRAPAREYGSAVTNVNLQQINYQTIKTLNLPPLCFAGSNPALGYPQVCKRSKQVLFLC